MKCPRCSGLVVNQYGEYGEKPERKCINCGARPDNIPLPPRPPDLRKVNGAHLVKEVKNECPRGHPWTQAGTYVYTMPSGRTTKRCRICSRQRYHQVIA